MSCLLRLVTFGFDEDITWKTTVSEKVKLGKEDKIYHIYLDMWDLTQD